MTTPTTPIEDSFQDHIHMLGCQMMTHAYNLGLQKAPKDEDNLIEMIEKHEAKLTALVMRDGERQVLLFIEEMLAAAKDNKEVGHKWSGGDYKKYLEYELADRLSALQPNKESE